MEEKKTRTEISQDLQEILNDFIEEQKAKGIKGVTKIKVLDQLCRAGLAFQQNPENEESSESNIAGVKLPDSNYPNEFILENKSELKAMQEALYEKEKRLIEKERFLLEKESIINQQYHDAIKLYEKYQKNQGASHMSYMEQMKLENKLDLLKGGHDDLSRDLKSLNRDLRKILREIKSNTDVDVFYDRILPWLTAAGVGANALKNFNVDEVLKNQMKNLGGSARKEKNSTEEKKK